MASSKLGLTKRQNDVYHFIRESAKTNGFPPTIQEICTKFGFASTNGVSQILHALEKKGWIERTSKHQARGIRILEKTDIAQTPTTNQFARTITIIGEGSADNSLAVFLTPEGQVTVDTRLFPTKGQIFAARVADSGLNAEGILEGDLVIAEQKQSPKDGDIVVAIVHNSRLVRKFTRKSGSVELLSSSKGFPKMQFSADDDSIAILGIVRGVLRVL